MAIVRWRRRDPFDPWDEVHRLQDEINSLFDVNRAPAANGLFDRRISPPVDVVENSDDYVVLCELPGIAKDDLDISIANNVLTIKGEKKAPKDNRKAYKQESWHGTFQRTLSLPAGVESAKDLSAELKDGVLRLTLPKREESKPKQIAVTIQ